jgi:hypothetical protein
MTDEPWPLPAAFTRGRDPACSASVSSSPSNRSMLRRCSPDRVTRSVRSRQSACTRSRPATASGSSFCIGHRHSPAWRVPVMQRERHGFRLAFLVRPRRRRSRIRLIVATPGLRTVPRSDPDQKRPIAQPLLPGREPAEGAARHNQPSRVEPEAEECERAGRGDGDRQCVDEGRASQLPGHHGHQRE